jgi:tripartite-type tricarboxylate transporter receptor subunit TctC
MKNWEDAMTRLVLSAICCFFLTASANATDFPTKPIRILVPYQAGGLVDLAARTIANEVQKKWQQPVVVENRPGASGTIAVRAAAEADPDGYTWLMTTNTEFTVNPALLSNVSYDLDRDFNPITMIVESPLAVVTSLQAPFDTVQGLVAYARKQPNAVPYASPGVGTLNNLLSEWLASDQSFKVQHVPYKGGAPAITAILSNEVQFGSLSLAVSKSLAESGKLKMLGVTSEKRSALAPEIPSLVESGIPVSATIWVGLFTQKKVPDEINSKIYDLVRSIVNNEDVRKRFVTQGVEPRTMTSRDFYAQIRTEEQQFKRIIQAVGVGK